MPDLLLIEKLDSERSKAWESIEPLAPKPLSSPVSRLLPCLVEFAPPRCPESFLDLFNVFPLPGSFPGKPAMAPLSPVLLSENSKSIDC